MQGPAAACTQNPAVAPALYKSCPAQPCVPTPRRAQAPCPTQPSSHQQTVTVDSGPHVPPGQAPPQPGCLSCYWLCLRCPVHCKRAGEHRQPQPLPHPLEGPAGRPYLVDIRNKSCAVGWPNLSCQGPPGCGHRCYHRSCPWARHEECVSVGSTELQQACGQMCQARVPTSYVRRGIADAQCAASHAGSVTRGWRRPG